jgi:hypothetical protein
MRPEFEPTADQRALLESASAFGITQAEIAARLKIGEPAAQAFSGRANSRSTCSRVRPSKTSSLRIPDSFPFRFIQTRDARALCGKLSLKTTGLVTLRASVRTVF